MALLDPYGGSWTSAEAAHLARRAGFGARPSELTAMVAAGMSAAVDSLVDYTAGDATLDAQIAALPSTTDNDALKDPYTNTRLEGWWTYRMVHSTQPLQQQFAIFLHDTLVSEHAKVSANVTTSANYGNDGSTTGQSCNLGAGGLPPDPNRRNRIVARLMLDQHDLFLTLGHGVYRDLIVAITRDPAMLIYLDNRLNLKGKPQENYAREVMELFTMGVGNYTEEDVREIARAFTGETINTACSANWPYSYVYTSSQHDTNSKTVFGTTFNQAGTGADTEFVLDLILNRVSNSGISPYHATLPATAVYMAWKFLTWFVQETIAIGDPVVGELAAYFHSTTYNVRETLRKLLKSAYFYDASHRYKMYKHPADYVVYAVRLLDLQETSYSSSVPTYLRGMGMRLFQPPNVAGWNHGRAWLNSGNLIYRYNYANRLSGTSILTDAYVDALITNGHVANTNDNAGILTYLASRLLQDTLLPAETQVFTTFFQGIQGATVIASQSQYRRKVRGALHLMMSMPRYQMK